MQSMRGSRADKKIHMQKQDHGDRLTSKGVGILFLKYVRYCSFYAIVNYMLVLIFK